MPRPSSGASKSDALALTISPYGYVEWRGPRAKLEARGLIPADFKWPKRIDYASWHADGFDFALRRCRPDGLNGPMRHWMTCDFWFVHTVPRLMGRGAASMSTTTTSSTSCSMRCVQGSPCVSSVPRCMRTSASSAFRRG